jgi:hypothetical protein
VASFDYVNYSIRPNKTIERKLVFSCLTGLTRGFPLREYRYIGMGSMWFVDFVLAHKILGITRMTSMERPGFAYDRALFNAPFKCIDVKEGETTRVLSELPLGETPVLGWLDYDGSLTPSVLADIAILVEQCASNSILLVTANAHKGSLPDKDEHGAELSDEARVRRIVGDLLPVSVDPKSLQQKNYPKLVGSILENQFRRALLNSGRPETFVKLFDIVYVDGPPMATIGGILADADKTQIAKDFASSPEWDGIVASPINIPALTLKEKIALDRLLPSNAPLGAAEVEIAGMKLKPEQVEAYRTHYRQYPIFGEFGF